MKLVEFMNIRSLAKNPFFYATVLLTGLLVWQVASIVLAQSASYTGPPGQPPNMTGIHAPLNTGPASQTKTGNLTISGASTVDGWFSAASGKIKINPTTGWLEFHDNNIPRAAFRYNPSNNALEFATRSLTNDSLNWQSIGVGAGGGESLWRKISGSEDIFYDKGDVKIVQATQTRTKYYYVFTGVVKENHQERRLSFLCDTDPEKIECGDEYAVEDYSSDLPQTAYDWYDEGAFLLGPPAPLIPSARAATPLSREYKLISRVETTLLRNNKLVAADIDLVQPRWAFNRVNVYSYNEGAPLARKAPILDGPGSGQPLNSVWIDRSSRCPSGQFVVGVQLAEWSGTLGLLVECNSF